MGCLAEDASGTGAASGSNEGSLLPRAVGKAEASWRSPILGGPQQLADSGANSFFCQNRPVAEVLPGSGIAMTLPLCPQLAVVGNLRCCPMQRLSQTHLLPSSPFLLAPMLTF